MSCLILSGIVVPSSFQVGDCVDFITSLSKLDKYSDKATSRSLERIFITGTERERKAHFISCRCLACINQGAASREHLVCLADCGRLVGYVTSMDLLVTSRTEALSRIARSCEVVVKDTDDYDDAVMAMRAKGLTYAPVVDPKNIVVRHTLRQSLSWHDY